MTKNLKNLGEKIDINQFIREFLEGLGTIQSKVRAILQEDLVNWEKLLSEIEMRFIEASSPDISLAGLALVREDDEKYVETSIVNTDIAKRRRALASKNDHFNGLSYRYVSNKI